MIEVILIVLLIGAMIFMNYYMVKTWKLLPLIREDDIDAIPMTLFVAFLTLLSVLANIVCVVSLIMLIDSLL